MAEILVLHHVLGRTNGMVDFATLLEASGHTVHLPDLFDGKIFATLEEGMAYVEKVGFEDVMARGVQTAENLSTELVYIGFSLGVAAAQKLSQTRQGTKGALFFHACLPTSLFESPWPDRLPAQIHAMNQDPYFVEDGDIDSARELARAAKDVNLFLYQGHEHLFTDNSLSSYDKTATTLAMTRTLAFLEKIN